MKLTSDEMYAVNEMLRSGETVRSPAVLSALDQMMNDMMNQAQMVQNVHDQAAQQQAIHDAMQQAVNQAHDHEVAHQEVAHEHAAHEAAADHEINHAHDLAEMDHDFADHTPALLPTVKVSPQALRTQSLAEIIVTLSRR